MQKEKSVKNERGAGRKMHDEKWRARFEMFQKALEDEMDKKTIMDKMTISRATYYRYLAYYKKWKDAQNKNIKIQ